MIPHELRAVLTSAGWFEGRRTAMSRYTDELRDYGVELVPFASDILEQYGDLILYPPKLEGAIVAPQKVDISPIKAARIAEPDRLEYWQGRLRMKLTPIAVIGDRAAMLLAEDGRVFMCYDMELSFLGSSWQDALFNTVLLGRRAPALYGVIDEDD